MHRLTTKSRFAKILAMCALVLLVGMGASECEGDDPGAGQRKESVKARADTFSKAERKYPLPKTENFPLRRMLIEMTKREDLANHPWYVYVLADTGNVIGYYVAKTAPINACNFLSSTEVITSGEDDGSDGSGSGNVVVHAPSIDGVFYGNSQCDVVVFEDYTTSAIVKLGDVKYFVADKPLNLEAEAISVKGGAK